MSLVAGFLRHAVWFLLMFYGPDESLDVGIDSQRIYFPALVGIPLPLVGTLDYDNGN